MLWVLWLTYGSFYFCRNNLGIAVPGIMAEFHYTKTDLGSVLNPPAELAYFRSAYAINNHGQLVAVAAVVPEPETYAMLLLGLGLIGFLARGRAIA